MAADLTTLANVKQYLNVTDFADDALLTRLISAESGWFYKQISREVITRTYVETIDGVSDRIRRMDSWGGFASSWDGTTTGTANSWSGQAIELYDWPVVTFTSLLIDGVSIPLATNVNQVGQTDGYLIQDNRRLMLIGTTYYFTTGFQNIVLTYDAGYGVTVPAEVEQAAIELVAWRYRERDRIGQQSKSMGGETVTFMPYAAPQSVLTVIDAYRRPNI